MSIIQDFKNRLEPVLEAGFPKVEEEGPEKVAMKRGPALAIFAEAVIGAMSIVKAFGGCEKCYGKGYSTQNVVVNMLPVTKMNFCTCDRVTQLETLYAG